MSAADLLSRLDRVRQRAADQWSARCPAHDDNGPSLSIRELPDGRTLMKCFAGCCVDEIVGAVGLEMDALFPPRAEVGDGRSAVQRRRLLSAAQALDLLHEEALVVAIVAADMASGVAPGADDFARVLTAAGRITYLRTEVMA